ncbi:MAG TPA: hypothetical protein V6D22_09025 [Candidatus Obscuribacterales bacterium]
MIKALSPVQRPATTEQFSLHRDEFMRALPIPAGTFTAESFHPYPVIVSADEYRQMARIQRALYRGINAVVSHYFTDSRIRDIIRLSEEETSLLREVVGQQCRVGTYRPDFLYDACGNIQICEINARFSSNGYVISQYLKMGQRLQYLPKNVQPKAHCDGGNYLRAFINRLDSSLPVFIVKGRESGGEIHFLCSELNNAGYSCRFIQPSQLKEALATHDKASCILELHQDEILDPANRASILEMARRWNYFNDLRTILIAHDKRMLAVFHREDIMRDYLEAGDAGLLREHVAPTYVLQEDSPQLSDALSNRAEWLVKPIRSGKGEGIVLGKSTDQETWARCLDKPQHEGYVLQRYIGQSRISMIEAVGNQVFDVPMNVVGLMLCFENEFLGPGVYRASASDVVNVASGGLIVNAI